MKQDYVSTRDVDVQSVCHPPHDKDRLPKQKARVLPAACCLLLAVLLNACGTSPTITPAPTRAPTQTPWIIERVITATAEPPTVTPLPTVTPAKPLPTPTRTRVAIRPTATRTAPVVVAPSPTTAPACSVGKVALQPNDAARLPENGAPRGTRKDQSGGSAFIFKWTPFQAGETDPHIGYRIFMESKRAGTGQHVNGATVYVSHNGFLRNGQQFIYDQRSVSTLAAGDNANVFWTITVVQTTGSFDDQGNVTGTVINCSEPTPAWTIRLEVPD